VDAREFAEAVDLYSRGRSPADMPTPAMAALDRYGREFNVRGSALSRSLIAAIIPMLAAIIMLIHYRPGRNQPFAKHLVLATHLFAAFLLFMLAVECLLWLLTAALQLAGQPNARRFSRIPELVPVLVMFVYAHGAFREVHGASRLVTALRAGLLAGLLFVPFVVYRALLFLATFYLS
jgi:hypothetical protein